MHVSPLGAGVKQHRFGRRAAKKQVSPEEVLGQMESTVAERCDDYPDFETSLRHFVSRHLCNETPGHTLLGVISADSRDGRTTVAIGLARALADVYRSVALVEIAEGEGIREQLMLPPRPGLRDFLAGRIGIEDLVSPTSCEKLWFVPAGMHAEPAHSLELVERLRLLLELLRSRFEVVVVDMPPILRNEQAPALVRCFDSGVLLTSAGMTRMDDVVETVRLCGPLAIRGVLLNRFRGMPRWITSLIEP